MFLQPHPNKEEKQVSRPVQIFLIVMDIQGTKGYFINRGQKLYGVRKGAKLRPLDARLTASESSRRALSGLGSKGSETRTCIMVLPMFHIAQHFQKIRKHEQNAWGDFFKKTGFQKNDFKRRLFFGLQKPFLWRRSQSLLR